VYVILKNFLVIDNTRTEVGPPLFDTSSLKHIWQPTSLSNNLYSKWFWQCIIFQTIQSPDFVDHLIYRQEWNVTGKGETVSLQLGLPETLYSFITVICWSNPQETEFYCSIALSLNILFMLLYFHSLNPTLPSSHDTFLQCHMLECMFQFYLSQC
jgi:hypothetical protein